MKIVLAVALLFPIVIFQIFIIVDSIKIARESVSSKKKGVMRQSNYYKNENFRRNNIRIISK